MIKNILNFIFPEKNICFICEDYGSDIEDNLCSICREKLVFIEGKSCSICGRKIENQGEDRDNIMKCRECIRHPHYFIKSTSPLSYEGRIKRAIYDFKYNDKNHLYKLFAHLMVKSIKDNDLDYIDIIVPIPLYRDREKKRGFNQAELLAREISKKLDIEMDTKNLVRSKKTKAQNKLDRNERKRNIKGVFEIKDKNKFMQKKILLVDDIYTTGSTVDECSKVLIENGADSIFVATLAVTPNTRDKRSEDIWK